MDKVVAICKREVQAYFYSPVAYAAMAFFLVFAAWIFTRNDLVSDQPAQMRNSFVGMVWPLIVVLPLLTMRLLSEEMSRGTIEPLMTAPVTDTQVVLGKYFGALAFYLVLLMPTLIFVGLLCTYASPDPGPILSGYVGLLLAGAAFTAIGLLASVVTRFQIVSAIVASSFLLTMTLLCQWGADEMLGWPRRFLQYIGFSVRYNNFAMGTIPLNDVVFFLSLIVLSLFASVKVLESRKWRA